MTTSVSIHVGGHYVTTVEQDGKEPVEVHGDYEGTPNPGGNHVVWLPHPATATLKITEKYLG